MELPFSDFYKMAACFKSGVTLKGLGGVENAAVVVVDSCALDVKVARLDFFGLIPPKFEH